MNRPFSKHYVLFFFVYIINYLVDNEQHDIIAKAMLIYKVKEHQQQSIKNVFPYIIQDLQFFQSFFYIFCRVFLEVDDQNALNIVRGYYICVSYQILLQLKMNNEHFKIKSRCSSSSSASLKCMHSKSSSSSGSIKLIHDHEIEVRYHKMQYEKDLFEELIDEECSHTREDVPDNIVSRLNLSPRQRNQQGCKCSKIDCLKMYCECFARGQICNKNCECVGCCNKPQCEIEIYRAKQMANYRHPGTFPGIPPLFPSKKCTCKKSQCRKNYCECFRAGLRCSQECECVLCHNGKPHDHEDMFDSRMQIQIQA